MFLLFTIPIGGGIPAGVVLAQSRGVGWIAMSVLYFFSDIVLACVFEPVMKAILHATKDSPFMIRFREKMKENTAKTIASFGAKPGPFMLILIAFGVDPMTGRAAALAQGHGFITGWIIAITGDMIFFGVVMASTLWLNSVLGDGTWTAIIIMVLMLGIPALIRRFRKPQSSL